MSALKFECPDCGQHMECERALSGDIIHCPRCCAELRIPFSSISGAILRAELLKHATPAPAGPAPKPAATAPAQAVAEDRDVICPVCDSELRVRGAAPKGDGKPHFAELIRKGEPKHAAPAPEPNRQEAHPDLKHMTVEERERHIAQAREAHPVQLSKPVKPRLSYVLEGKSPAEDKPQKDGGQEHPPFSE